jgi:hypothetical protein
MRFTNFSAIITTTMAAATPSNEPAIAAPSVVASPIASVYAAGTAAKVEPASADRPASRPWQLLSNAEESASTTHQAECPNSNHVPDATHEGEAQASREAGDPEHGSRAECPKQSLAHVDALPTAKPCIREKNRSTPTTACRRSSSTHIDARHDGRPEQHHEAQGPQRGPAHFSPPKR